MAAFPQYGTPWERQFYNRRLQRWQRIAAAGKALWDIGSTYYGISADPLRKAVTARARFNEQYSDMKRKAHGMSVVPSTPVKRSRTETITSLAPSSGTGVFRPFGSFRMFPKRRRFRRYSRRRYTSRRYRSRFRRRFRRRFSRRRFRRYRRY